jgi:transposase
MYFTVVGGSMHDYSFYSAILGLSSNWRILNVTVDERSGDIELHIRSRKGSKFSCPSCGALKLPSGVSKARWLHENHLNIRFYISALIPVITCERCGELKADIPWEQTGAAREENEQVYSPGEDTTKPLQLF